MSSDTEIDLMIVGQGLAGSAVAMRALARGFRIIVLDNPSQNRSSRVSAGLFNPITGKKNSKTWLADEIFPALHRYYRDVERLTEKRFFHPMPIYRPFLSIEEQNEWMGTSAAESYREYIGEVTVSGGFGGKVNDPFGGISLKQSGYLDTGTYLEAVREYLGKRAVYQAATFAPENLEILTDSVRYGNFGAKKIVFCQGVHNAANPWFNMFPVNSLKGEFITIQCDWKTDVILNRGVYLVPGSQPGVWRVGATYNRYDHSPETTQVARTELIAKLEGLVRMPYTITGQEWGVRPTTPDRKPLIGMHPQNRSLIIFNGFGTKGVSLAPYFSEVLIRWLEKKGTIGKEADVTRFY